MRLKKGCLRDDHRGAHTPLYSRRGTDMSRAIRSHTLWLTVGYFSVLVLLAKAYA